MGTGESKESEINLPSIIIFWWKILGTMKDLVLYLAVDSASQGCQLLSSVDWIDSPSPHDSIRRIAR